jgi:hypothetical protein
MATCPFCGARFTDGPGGINPFTPPAVNVPDPGMARPQAPAFNDGVYMPPSTNKSNDSSRSFMTVKVILITLGALLLLGIGMAAVIITLVKQQNAQKRRRRRSRRRYRDDDDY